MWRATQLTESHYFGVPWFNVIPPRQHTELGTTCCGLDLTCQQTFRKGKPAANETNQGKGSLPPWVPSKMDESCRKTQLSQRYPPWPNTAVELTAAMDNKTPITIGNVYKPLGDQQRRRVLRQDAALTCLEARRTRGDHGFRRLGGVIAEVILAFGGLSLMSSMCKDTGMEAGLAVLSLVVLHFCPQLPMSHSTSVYDSRSRVHRRSKPEGPVS